MERDQYAQIWNDAAKVRQLLDELIKQSPELFPPSIQSGYQLSGYLPESKKMPRIRLRQLQIKSGVYSLRPSERDELYERQCVRNYFAFPESYVIIF